MKIFITEFRDLYFENIINLNKSDFIFFYFRFQLIIRYIITFESSKKI